VLAEEECLLDLLSGGMTGNQQPKNKQHFVLATADPLPVRDKKNAQTGKGRRPMSASTGADIRAHARAIPGVPVIYVKRSVMILEELSGASLGVRRREEKGKFREGLLGTESRKRKRDEDDNDDRNDEEKESGGGPDPGAPKKTKTKKVRGPNPLSVLKKKPRPKQKVQQSQALDNASKQASSPKLNGVSTEESQPKATRKRKHGKKRDANAGLGEEDQDFSKLRDGMSNADEG